MRFPRVVRVGWLGAVLLFLAACGGGGDEGGGGGSSRGAFTISATAATFRATQGGAMPPSQSFQVSVTGSDAAYSGAAYQAGQGTQPSRLTVSANGSGSSFQLVVGVIPGAVAPGSYSTTFSVGTADSNGNVLQSRNFTVTFDYVAGVTLTTPPVLQNMVFGETPRVRTVNVGVNAPGRSWTVSSNSPWLQVPATTQTGSSTVVATLDTTALAPGSYSAQLRVVATDNANDAATLPVSLAIVDPVLSIAPASFTFGGSDGLAPLAQQSIPVSLNTGTTTHPFTITVTTDSGGSWLQPAALNGSVGAAGANVGLDVVRGALPGGTYTGELRLTANVFGRSYEQRRPVTLNIEADRMVASAAGIGLSRVGSRDVLTRTLRVYSTTGRASMSWQAAANVPWLTVTPSGMAGGALVVTANPSGLATETTHYGTVTITSPDASVENQQTVRVGLHITATSAIDLSQAWSGQFLASSPVDPWLAVSNAGTGVALYDVYTGALVRTLDNIVARAGSMTFSDDGRLLYVYDSTNFRVVSVDAVSGSQQGSYDAFAAASPNAGAVSMIRPAGVEMLVTPGGRIHGISAATPAIAPVIAPGQSSLSWSRSPDQSLFAMHSGIAYRLKHSALMGGSITSSLAVLTGTAQGRDGEACISANGDRIYTASGFPYYFPATSVSTGQVIQQLPGTNYPNSMLCSWNGLVIGGAAAYYNDVDIFVYNGASGDPRGQFSSNGLTGGYRDLIDRGLAISADGTRLMSVWVGNMGNGIYFRSLPAP